MSEETLKKKKSPLVATIALVTAGIVCVGIIVFAVAMFTSGAKKNAVFESISLGDKCLLEHDYENAILAYEEALKLDPKNTEAYLGEAYAYQALVDDAVSKNDYDEALKYLDEAIASMERGVENTQNEEIKEYLERFQNDRDTYLEKKDSTSQNPEGVDTKATEDGEISAEEFFSMVAMDYVCTPGFNWGTSLEIKADGSFTGHYDAYDYSGERAYEVKSESDFSGRFVNPKKINDYVYEAGIEGLSYSAEVGKEETSTDSNGTHILVHAAARGLAEGKTFRFYLKGADRSLVDENYFSWVDSERMNETILSRTGIYNVEEGYGFEGWQ